MPRLIANGRIAWILALVFGVILVIVGIVVGSTGNWSTGGWLVGVGAAFALLGSIFLILSLATRGQTD